MTKDCTPLIDWISWKGIHRFVHQGQGKRKAHGGHRVVSHGGRMGRGRGRGGGDVVSRQRLRGVVDVVKHIKQIGDFITAKAEKKAAEK